MSIAVVLDPLPVVPKHPTAPQRSEIVEEGFRGEGVVARVVHEVESNHSDECSAEDGPPKGSCGERHRPAVKVERQHCSEFGPSEPSGLVGGSIEVLFDSLLEGGVESVLVPDKEVFADVLRKSRRVVDGLLDLVLFQHLVDGFGGDGMKRLEELSAIASFSDHEDVLSSRVVLGELGEVVALAVDDPEILGVKVELGEEVVCDAVDLFLGVLLVVRFDEFL